MSRQLLLLCLVAPYASGTFTFGTAKSQDPLPPCEVQVLCNGDVCGDVCKDGTVSVDPWLAYALAFQRNLTRARPFSFGPHLGTHNALISRANGMGLEEDYFAQVLALSGATPAATHVRVPNQRLGLTDLLNLGVRHVEYDLWDVPSPTTGGAFEVRICHSPVPDPGGFAAVEAALAAAGMAPLTWDPFLSLCSNHTLQWAMELTKAWLLAHPDEVLGCYLDNRVAPWNADLITQALTSVWGSMLLTPGDLLGPLFNATRGDAATFPSRDAMLAQGKRIYCESNSYVGTNFTPTSLSTVAFYPTTWDAAWFGGGQPGPQDVNPFPNCSIAGAGAWLGRSWPRLLDSGDLEQSPEEAAEHSIVLKPNGVADLAACAVPTIGLADISPLVARAFVWSWQEGQPAPATGACRGAAMASVRGGWSALPCAAQLPVLCRRGDARAPAGLAPALWALSNATAPFGGAAGACSALGSGWAPGLPRDGMENARAAQLAMFARVWQQHAGLWLAHQVE